MQAAAPAPAPRPHRRHARPAASGDRGPAARSPV